MLFVRRTVLGVLLASPLAARCSSQDYTTSRRLYRPVIITGPSGVGKGTLIKMLMSWRPDLFGFSVSHTTRQPRPGEVDGKDYHFITIQEMEERISRDEFIEYANVHGNYYGTSKRAVRDVGMQGKICILDIDVQGSESIYAAKLTPKPLFIFLGPPSFRELEKRLRGRGTETEESVQRRLANAVQEVQKGRESEVFDYCVVNDELMKAFEDLKKIIEKEVLAEAEN